jgi:hypothetical protein
MGSATAREAWSAQLGITVAPRGDPGTSKRSAAPRMGPATRRREAAPARPRSRSRADLGRSACRARRPGAGRCADLGRTSACGSAARCRRTAARRCSTACAGAQLESSGRPTRRAAAELGRACARSTGPSRGGRATGSQSSTAAASGGARPDLGIAPCRAGGACRDVHGWLGGSVGPASVVGCRGSARTGRTGVDGLGIPGFERAARSASRAFVEPARLTVIVGCPQDRGACCPAGAIVGRASTGRARRSGCPAGLVCTSTGCATCPARRRLGSARLSTGRGSRFDDIRGAGSRRCSTRSARTRGTARGAAAAALGVAGR